MTRVTVRLAIQRQPLAGAALSQAQLVPPCDKKSHCRHDSADPSVQENIHKNRTCRHLAAPFLLLLLPTCVTHRSSNSGSGAKHVPVESRSQPPSSWLGWRFLATCQPARPRVLTDSSSQIIVSERCRYSRLSREPFAQQLVVCLRRRPLHAGSRHRTNRCEVRNRRGQLMQTQCNSATETRPTGEFPPPR
jgi:hypothetical protein